MINKLLVSVITPSYNQGRFIEETILSVKHQDYPHIEHIIVDGGSKDDTLDVLHKYSNIVRWISEPDRGFADGVNKGIHMSSGEILAIQNADDTYHGPSAIRKAVEAFIDNPTTGVVFGDSATIDKDGKILRSGERAHQGFSFSALLCSEFVLPQASAFILRSALEMVGGELDMSVDYCADFDLWVRIGLRFPIIYTSKVLANYRVHPEHRNANPSYAYLNARDRRRVLDKVFSMHDLPLEIQKLQDRAYARTYLNQANRLRAFGRMKDARKCIVTAIKLYPLHLLNQSLYRTLLMSLLSEGLIDYLRKVKHFQVR